MKSADFNTLVRELLEDGGDEEEARHSPASLLGWINEGRKRLFGLRPEAFYVSGIVRSYPGDLAAGADIDLLPEYDSQLANYCVYRALSIDREDAVVAAQADHYLNLFTHGM